jgi:lipopolysaccharide biosynthesis glycosyltransferase
MNSLSIVYATDDNFAGILGVSLVSLFENNRHIPEIDVYILDNGISQSNKEKLQSISKTYHRKTLVFIKATDINKILGMDVKHDRGSLAQYARLFVSSALPENLERVLYLDCDIIINRPLDDLWNLDMHGKTVAALMDAFSSWYRTNIELDKNDIMFNSGVMLIDLKRWKKNQIEENLMKFISSHNGHIQQGDQGALNAILSNDTYCFNPRFNSITVFFDFTYKNMLIYRKSPKFYSEEQVKLAIEQPVIIHFTTSFLSKRPWIKGCKHQYRDRWMEYKNMSPWKDEELREHVVSTWKKYFIKFYKVLPVDISVRIAGVLHAYLRPFVNKCYRVFI